MWCEKFESVKVCRCMFVRVKRTPNCAKTRKQSGCRVPLRKKFCTSEARKPFFAAGSCSRDCLIVLRILCFGYSLRYANERTNERTIIRRTRALSSTRTGLCAICFTLCCARGAMLRSGILFALRYCSILNIIT